MEGLYSARTQREPGTTAVTQECQKR